MLPKTLGFSVTSTEFVQTRKKIISCISGQTNTGIEIIFLEREPRSTMTMLSLIIRKEPTLDINLSKEEKNIN